MLQMHQWKDDYLKKQGMSAEDAADALLSADDEYDYSADIIEARWVEEP